MGTSNVSQTHADSGGLGPDSAVIDVQHVSKAFGATVALRAVSVQITSGEARGLVGRNGAGKSTLVAILAGTLHPDSGTVRVGVDSDEAASAASSRVACVYQKSTLVPGLTAAENVLLGHYPVVGGRWVRWRALRNTARQLLAEWGCEHVLEQLVEALDPVERKIVEICRALATGAPVLLLDEPTAGLDATGVARLFDAIGSARERGVTVVYVSHHLEEIYAVCDRITVLRDGRHIVTARVDDLPMTTLVQTMVGGSGSELINGEGGATAGSGNTRLAGDVKAKGTRTSSPAIRVDGVSLPPRLERVSFSLQESEIVGLAGLDGSGATQLAEILAGLRKPLTGAAYVGDRRLPFGNVGACIRAGVGFVPEDRQVAGFIPALAAEENTTLPVLHELQTRIGFISSRARRTAYLRHAKEWEIKAKPTQPTEELSGGNQQKVVLARAFASRPRALVLINPTAGVDIAAKAAIYRSVRAAAEMGTAVLMVSADESDLALCDRVLVLFKGLIVGELGASWSEHQLTELVHGVRPSGACMSNGPEGRSL
jgi:simple sugar transport system ATP-binding protein